MLAVVAGREFVETISHRGQPLAIVIRNGFEESGVHFVTPRQLSQQVAYISHPAGKLIEPHTHNQVPREVSFTQEVLLIKKGRLRVDFYSEHREYLESRILERGDTILLIAGGHGFEVLRPVEMIEVKQGPYLGDNDKSSFVGITTDQVRLGGGADNRLQRAPTQAAEPRHNRGTDEAGAQ
jgi:hypothetical protein